MVMDLQESSQDQPSRSTSSSPPSLPHRWAAAWSARSPSAWLALYTPHATYIDHAFQIRRTGLPVLERHFDIWRNSIPDFTMEVERLDDVDVDDGGQGKGKSGSGSRRCSIRTINRGTFVADLPSKKASGRRFEFRGVVDFVIRQGDGEGEGDGLIERVDEYYSFNFDGVEGVGGFHVLDSEDLGGS